MPSTGVLRGKHVLITGAGRGLGEAYARAAVTEGARVVISDINAESVEAVAASINGAGGEALAVVSDVTDWDSCEKLVAAAVERFGKLDGLVNNAGYLNPTVAGTETEADIRLYIDIGVYGTYFMSVHGLAAMQGSGSIVNVTSGAQVGLRMMSAYAAAKGAVASLTYAWANEFGGQDGDIRVNAMAPHASTPMMDAGDGRLYEVLRRAGGRAATRDERTRRSLLAVRPEQGRERPGRTPRERARTAPDDPPPGPGPATDPRLVDRTGCRAGLRRHVPGPPSALRHPDQHRRAACRARSRRVRPCNHVIALNRPTTSSVRQVGPYGSPTIHGRWAMCRPCVSPAAKEK